MRVHRKSLEACESPTLVQQAGPSGPAVVREVPCGKCKRCGLRYAVARSWDCRRMVEYHGRQDWFFISLTFAPSAKYQKPEIHHARAAWLTFRKNYLWRYHSTSEGEKSPWFQVYENWEPNAEGRLNIHLLVKSAKLYPVPGMKKGGEYIIEYWARLTEWQKKWATQIQRCGFGVSSEVERLQRGPGGAREYMLKRLRDYMGKDLSKVKESNGVKVRRLSFSRNAFRAYCQAAAVVV